MAVRTKQVSFDEYDSACQEYEGYCTTCQEFTTGGCEPDAREYECESCGENTVYGAEEAMMTGLIAVSMDEE